ncbi:MAG: hypothetical protein LBC21_03945 [Oscillospiraceae bacterium]|nr:hypothetical protein [Oscillospiraceae bacterium]
MADCDVDTACIVLPLASVHVMGVPAALDAASFCSRAARAWFARVVLPVCRA